MSSLQLWLAVLGAVVLTAFLVHALLLSRRVRHRQADASQISVFREPEADEVDTVLDPQLDPDEPPRPVVTRRVVMPPHVDALLDAIVTLHPGAPISGEQALAHLPPSRRAGNKPFLIEGLNL
ncbi:MAG: hypothetical protein RJA44_1054, partial [Pseudomonadota bacterium]